MKSDYRIAISDRDFERLREIVKLVLNDLDDLLAKHDSLNLIIKGDGSVHFNLKRFRLSVKTLRIIISLYNKSNCKNLFYLNALKVGNKKNCIILTAVLL
jgi:hypothetical protein